MAFIIERFYCTDYDSRTQESDFVILFLSSYAEGKSVLVSVSNDLI
jgi:hypothetical protein